MRLELLYYVDFRFLSGSKKEGRFKKIEVPRLIVFFGERYRLNIWYAENGDVEVSYLRGGKVVMPKIGVVRSESLEEALNEVNRLLSHKEKSYV